MRGWWLWLALAACGEQRERAVPAPAPAPVPAPTAITPADAAPAPAPAVIALPATPGLPIVADGLRPYMQRAEAEAVLRTLTRPSTWPRELRIDDNARASVFAVTADMFLEARFRSDQRLWRVVFASTATHAFPAAVHARWGKGTTMTAPGFEPRANRSIERWMTKDWHVELRVGPGRRPDDKPQFAELAFEASDPVDAEQPAAGDTSAPSFEAIAKLIGKPLDAASALFGDALHVEPGDEERPQGFARVHTAWSLAPWEITLHTDAAGEQIEDITLDGEAIYDAQHVIVMRQLERAFGPRRAIITEVGDPAIGFGGGGRIEAQASKLGAKWTIQLRRR